VRRMVVDPRQQIKTELQRDLAKLRVQLESAPDKEARKAIKREMRQLRTNARRLQRNAIW
jgi:hypothetical protein